jgi:hypothetical protein
MNQNVTDLFSFCICKTKYQHCHNIKYCFTNLSARKRSIPVIWNIIFPSYLNSDKYFEEGISRSSQGSSVQRGSPDREITTCSASGVELKLKYLGRTSLETPTALVLTMCNSEERIQATCQWQLESSTVISLVMTWGWIQILVWYYDMFIVQSGGASPLVQVSQNAFITILMFLITVLMHNRSRFESYKTL